MNDKTADRVLAEFEKALTVDGKASKTLQSYVGDVRGFLRWLESKGSSFAGTLKRFHITSYRSTLVEEGYEINTINKKINSLVSFNQFLMDQKVMTERVVDLKKDKLKVAAGSEAEVDIFTDVEIEKLLFHVQSDQVSARDRVVVLLLLYTGIRVSELVHIKLKEVDVLGMNLTIGWEKGGKRREVPLKGEVLAVIKAYLDVERRNSRFAESQYLLAMPQNMGNQEKLDYIFSELKKGTNKDELARSLSYKTFKSMDMFVRRQGYTWDKWVGKYLLPEERSSGKYAQPVSIVSGKVGEILTLFSKEEQDARRLPKGLDLEGKGNSLSI